MVSTQTNIRLFIPSSKDLQYIAQLYHACFTAPDKGENWTQDSAERYIKDQQNKGSLFIDLRDEEGKLIGILCGSAYQNSVVASDITINHERCFYIALIAIDPQHHKQGLGKKLLSQSLKEIKKQGYDQVITRYRTTNALAQNLFEHNGFEEIHRYTCTLGGVECQRIIALKAII